MKRANFNSCSKNGEAVVEVSPESKNSAPVTTSGNPEHKRKNLKEFQMLAAVYHKGDHGHNCYTLK